MQITKLEGLYHHGVEQIKGTDKVYYSISSTDDLYDIVSELIPYNEELYGNEISFFVYPECRVYTPFKKQKGVYYQGMSVMYYEDAVYFLQGDFNNKQVNLFQWDLNKDELSVVTSLNMDGISLYNISLQAYPIMISAEHREDDRSLEIYYPERLSLPQNERESLEFRDGNAFYFSSWNEDDNDEREFAYWEEYVVKDQDGNIIAKGNGSITLMPDGKYYIL